MDDKALPSRPQIRFGDFVCMSEEFDLHLSFVGLSSTGHGVTDTRPGQRVHRLHDDKGPLLQRGHRQMPVV